MMGVKPECNKLERELGDVVVVFKEREREDEF